MRTQQEIRARYDSIDPVDDFFGVRREELVFCLDYEHASDLLKAGITPDQWNPYTSDDEVLLHARDYLVFAVEKAINHRSLSASRSLDHLTEIAWILGRDDLAAELVALPFAMYGAPALERFAAAIEFRPADMDTDTFKRMAAGEPCVEGCDEGCGS